MKNKIRIAIIGCGHISQAMIGGMINPASVAVLKANGDVFDITIADRNESKLMKFRGACKVTLEPVRAVAAADYIIIAVKPQDADALLSSLNLSDKVVISVMAGYTIEKLRAATGASRIVRVMPNLNARVGESFSAYAHTGLSAEEVRVVTEILGSFGTYSEIDENKMNDVTAITGSGPAFVFMTVKAFYDEAVARGFSCEQAKEMAVQTILGSVLTAEKFDGTLDELITSVCSPGGTTERGVGYLNENKFEEVLRGGIRKSIERAEELCK